MIYERVVIFEWDEDKEIKQQSFFKKESIKEYVDVHVKHLRKKHNIEGDIDCHIFTYNDCVTFNGENNG